MPVEEHNGYRSGIIERQNIINGHPVQRNNSRTVNVANNQVKMDV